MLAYFGMCMFSLRPHVTSHQKTPVICILLWVSAIQNDQSDMWCFKYGNPLNSGVYCHVRWIQTKRMGSMSFFSAGNVFIAWIYERSSLWKWMIGIWLFPFGAKKAYFQVLLLLVLGSVVWHGDWGRSKRTCWRLWCLVCGHDHHLHAWLVGHEAARNSLWTEKNGMQEMVKSVCPRRPKSSKYLLRRCLEPLKPCQKMFRDSNTASKGVWKTRAVTPFFPGWL